MTRLEHAALAYAKALESPFAHGVRSGSLGREREQWIAKREPEARSALIAAAVAFAKENGR